MTAFTSTLFVYDGYYAVAERAGKPDFHGDLTAAFIHFSKAGAMTFSDVEKLLKCLATKPDADELHRFFVLNYPNFAWTHFPQELLKAS